jgi:outer membrane protein assembly factor BamB
MEDGGASMNDFMVEMGDFEVKKVGKFDRMWKVGEGGTAYQAPIIVGDIIYFGSCNHNVYAVNIKSGKLVWKFRTPGSPAYVPPPFEAFELQTTVSSKEAVRVRVF